MRQVIDSVPLAPIAGTATVHMFNEKMQVGLLFLGDIVALRVIDVFSKYSLLIPVISNSPKEVRGAPCAAWIGIVGQPQIIQTDEA